MNTTNHSLEQAFDVRDVSGLSLILMTTPMPSKLPSV